MTPTTWNRLGWREKQVLAILRRADGPLTTREVLTRLREGGDDLAYTTVGTVLDRLSEKGVTCREEEIHSGSPRHRYRFDAAAHRRPLVEGVVEDVAAVLGDPGLDLLAQHAAEARTTRTTEDDHA